jgi:hypothetical protein
VAVLTIVSYVAFVAFLGHGPATSAVFALLALAAFPAFSRRQVQGPSFDEREREIAGKAQMAGFGAFWLAFVSVIVAIGFARGWSGTLTMPVWTLSEIIFWAWILVMSVQSLATIMLYRGGTHV